MLPDNTAPVRRACTRLVSMGLEQYTPRPLTNITLHSAFQRRGVQPQIAAPGWEGALPWPLGQLNNTGNLTTSQRASPLKGPMQSYGRRGPGVQQSQAARHSSRHPGRRARENSTPHSIEGRIQGYACTPARTRSLPINPKRVLGKRRAKCNDLLS